MQISSEELIDLIVSSGSCAGPNEHAQTEAIIRTIARGQVTANSESAKSHFLKNLVNQHRHFFKPEYLQAIEDVLFFGVDIDLTNAIAQTKDHQKRVIVFDGLLHIVHFYADLITTLAYLQKQRPEKTYVVDGQELPEALALSMASFARLIHYMGGGSYPATLSDLLAPSVRRHVNIGYLGAILFILAHEVGHIHLGHTAGGRVISERQVMDLALPETINTYQEYELQADHFALSSFRDAIRTDIISSVLFFLGPNTFLEAFVSQSSRSHPMAVNRAANLAKLLDATSPVAERVGGVITSQVEGILAQERRRAAGNGDIRDKVYQKMPPDEAVRIIVEIKERIKRETGLLGDGVELSKSER